MEIIKKVDFGINHQTVNAQITNLCVWRVSSSIIPMIEIVNPYANKILGINFKSNVTDFVLATTLRKEHQSLGQATVSFLRTNLSQFDLGILDPAGFDYNSIELVLQSTSDMPLLVILDPKTYYTLFEDESYGEVQRIRALKRTMARKFEAKPLK